MSEFTFTERNLILTGYIGPEQMTLGRRIARKLNMPYANVEMTIADRLDLPVDEIRTYFGDAPQVHRGRDRTGDVAAAAVGHRR